MVSLFSCVPWGLQHDRSRGVKLLWNADASLSGFSCDLELSRRPSRSPDRKAGHGNEADLCRNCAPCWQGSDSPYSPRRVIFIHATQRGVGVGGGVKHTIFHKSCALSPIFFFCLCLFLDLFWQHLNHKHRPSVISAAHIENIFL